jgi:hypothetical protein
MPGPHPRRETLFWGEGWGWPTDDPQRPPTRPAHGEAPGGWRVCRVPAACPPSVCRAGKPMPPLLQRGFDSLEDTNTANPTMLANGVKSAKFTDVKDSEKRADNPPKAPGERVSGLWGRVSPGPRQLWGPRPGGLLARPAGGPVKGSCPEARVR